MFSWACFHSIIGALLAVLLAISIVTLAGHLL